MNPKLIAFAIRRRLICTAVFAGKTLEYLDITHLSNQAQTAMNSVSRVVSRASEHFKPDSAALAISRRNRGERVQQLTEQAETLLTAAGIPIQRVEQEVLLENYSVSPLKNKAALRAIALSLWPQVEKRKIHALDAALAGFYVQVERVLSQH